MKHYILVGLALAAAAGACTSSPAAGPSASNAPAASHAGVSGGCIDPRQIDKQDIVSDQEIRFKLRNGEVWTNKLPAACFGLKIEGGFSWEVRGALVCSNQEKITVNESGTPCLLGEFSRIT